MTWCASGSYVMEDPRERFRLAAKVDADGWVQKYLSPRLRGDERVLDVGCGPGVIARAVLEAYPEVTLAAIERSPDRVSGAREKLDRRRAIVVAADACELALETDSVDVAYTRFLLEYLADRSRAVAEMTRVCRPGGIVMLQDLDGQLVWHDGMTVDLRADVERVLETLRSTGFDPFVGRRLFGLARQAGLRQISTKAESYHLYAGQIDDEALNQWSLKLDIARPVIAATLGGDRRADLFRRAFLDHLGDPGTLTYSVIFTVVGRV